MQKVRKSIGYFSAAGMVSSYTEVYDTDGITLQIQYLNSHIQWPRISYLTRY